MALLDDVTLLKCSQVASSEREAFAAAQRVMEFLDKALAHTRVWTYPRGYYYEVTSGGSEQLCMPTWVESHDEAAWIFAKDVSSGFLEELCDVLEPQPAAHIRSELGL
jgi:hypothetical protein